MSEPDPQILERLTEELKQAPCLVLKDLHPPQVFSLVALLQVALRHPDIEQDGGSAAMARVFISDVLEFYRDYPTITQVIRMGFDS